MLGPGPFPFEADTAAPKAATKNVLSMSAEELQISGVRAERHEHDTWFEFIEANDTRVRRTDMQIRRIPFFDHSKVEVKYADAADMQPNA